MPTYLAPRLAGLGILGIPFVFSDIPGPIDWMCIKELSSFGLVAWIVYTMFTKWLPAIYAANAQQLKEQREAHTAAVNLLADSHATAVKILAESHASSVKHLTDAFERSLAAQRTDLLARIEHR